MLHLYLIGIVNWMNALEYRRLKKVNQRQNLSIGYIYEIQLHEGFAYQLWLGHRSLELSEEQQSGSQH